MPIDDKRKSTIGSGRASIILSKSSSSKKGGNSRKNATPTYSGLQVIENGKNMTPLPLFKVPTNDLGFDNHSFIPGSEPGSPDLPSPNQFNNESLSVSTPPMSPSGGGQDDGSIKSPNRRRASKATESIHKMKRALSITRRASHGEALKQQSTLQQTPHHGHHKHDDDGPTIPNGLKFEDLKKPVHFSLTESKTISLFHIATSCVADDDPKLNAVKTKNAQYVELCAAKIGGSDKYVARSAQTLNNAVKDKTTTTTTTTTKNASSLAIGFVIEDDYKTRQDEEEAIILGESKEKDSDGPRELQKEVSVAVDAALAAPGALLPLDTDSNKSDGTGIGFNLSSGRKSSPRTNEPWSGASSGSENGGYDNEPTIAEVTAQQLKTKVMTSKNLEMSLHTVERAVMQNMFHAKQLRYRGLPNAADDEDSDLVFGGPSNFAASPSSSPLSPAPASPAQTQVVPVLPSTPAAPPNTLEPVAQQTTEGGGGEGGGDTNGQSPGQAASEPISPLPAPPQPSNHRLNQAQKAANVYVDSSTNEEGKSRLSPLFDFICPESKGRIIHAMAFNKTNFDVLAVAYGHKQHQHHGSRANTPTHSPHGGTGERGANMNDKKDNHAHSDDGKGLVAFWSLRNPEYPERLIHTLTGVTALDFSSRIPNLLAVGLQDGTVAIYNLKRDGGDLGVPILDSSALPSKHMEAVWQVKWVDKGTERGECLVSVSTDGRIAEWGMKKGLASATLMVLRRSGNAEGSISRTAAGLSFDFPIGDPNTYFAGAEDGTLHRCSCSYTEQSLDATPGHAGPIYRVRCSPKHPSAILTCGADWSVKLWQKGTCVQTFHPGDLTDAVHDVCWSPLSSTVFASVAGDGRVEVYDLAISKLDPSVSMFCDGTVNEDTYEDYDDPDFKGEKLPAQTSVLFAPVSKVLLVGDELGRVKLYEMQNFDLSSEFSDPQRLVDAMQGSKA